MKKSLLTCGIVAAYVAGLCSFTTLTQSSITGRVSPADGAETVWAISGNDSAKATISSGAFAFQVKPGIYKVIVDGKDPYKDVTLENVEVKPDQPIDLGEIVLQK